MCIQIQYGWYMVYESIQKTNGCFNVSKPKKLHKCNKNFATDWSNSKCLSGLHFFFLNLFLIFYVYGMQSKTDTISSACPTVWELVLRKAAFSCAQGLTTAGSSAYLNWKIF